MENFSWLCPSGCSPRAKHQNSHSYRMPELNWSSSIPLSNAWLGKVNICCQKHTCYETYMLWSSSQNQREPLYNRVDYTEKFELYIFSYLFFSFPSSNLQCKWSIIWNRAELLDVSREGRPLGSGNFTSETREMDFRPGGSWYSTFKSFWKKIPLFFWKLFGHSMCCYIFQLLRFIADGHW